MSTPSKSTPKTISKASFKPAVKALAKPLTKPATKIIKRPVKKVVHKSTATASKALVPDVTTTPAAKLLIEKPIKAKKIKLVRDSFTIPKPEYLMLDNLKLRATDLKHPVKKGELIRAGIKALAALTDANLLVAIKAVPILKSGRPSK